MPIPLETAQAHLNAWLAADIAVSQNQSYQMGLRKLQRADAAEISEKIKFWRNEVERLQKGRSGMRVMRVVPRDL